MTAPIPPVGNTATTTTATTTNTDPSQLSSQAFLQLLVAQLKYQDPSSPADMNSFMTQTATLNQMQTMQQLSSVTGDLLKQSQLSQALALVGKTISYTGPGGTTETGTVTAVSMGGSPALTVGQSSIPLSSITSVQTA